MRITADVASNSIIVLGTPDQVQAMRTVIQGIDVKNPTQATLEVVPLRTLKPRSIIARLHGLYPNARISQASASSVFVKAVPLDMMQIKSLIGTLDTPTATASPSGPPAEALRVTQTSPRAAARAIARQLPRIRASVAGSSVIVVGSAEDISKAKALIASIDQPAFGSRYTQVYRIKNIDAGSVGSLVSRSYPNAKVNVDKDLNAISVFATAGEQQRIGDAIAQLDGNAGGQVVPGGVAINPAYGSSNVEVVELKSAMPGQGLNGASTTATDIGQAVTQSLQQLAPDLRVTVPANSTSIILSGSPQSLRLAKDLVDRLDKTTPLVVLDTEVLEVDE